MLEVKSLIAKQTCHKVSLEHDVSDMDEVIGVVARFGHGQNFKNNIADFANFLQPLGPLHTISLNIIILSLELAGKLELIRDFHFIIRNDITSSFDPADVSDSCTERPNSCFGELCLNGIDQHLVVLAIFISRFEVIHSAFHIAREEVPGLSLLETRHGEDVLRLLFIDEELQGEGREKTCRFFSQVHGLREANDIVYRFCRVEASVAQIIRDGLPRDFGDETLSVDKLQAVLLHFIGVFLEGTFGRVGEDLVEFGPEVVVHGCVCYDHIPQVNHLV